MFLFKNIQTDFFIEIPEPDGLVLRIRHDDLAVWIFFVMHHHEDAWDIVHMAKERVLFPRLLVIVLPDLDFAVIGGREDVIVCEGEIAPIDASIMSLKHCAHFHLDANGGHAFKPIYRGNRSVFKLFAQLGEVPQPQGLIQRARNYQVFCLMEPRAHHIMRVASDNLQKVPVLIVPESHCLVVTRRQNPWQLLMELHCSKVIQMAQQLKQLLFGLVVVDADLVVVAAGDKQRLRRVEAYPSHWPFVVLVRFY